MNHDYSITHLEYRFVLRFDNNSSELYNKLCFFAGGVLTICSCKNRLNVFGDSQENDENCDENSDAASDDNETKQREIVFIEKADDIIIHLSDIEHIFDTSDNTSYSFSLSGHNKTYTFYAKDHTIVQKWMTALLSESPELGSHHISLKSFHFLSIIGRGFSGEVILAKYLPTGKLVALKSIPKGEGFGSPNGIKHAVAERNILMQAAAPFITRLLSAFQTKDRLFFALEFVPGGDLGYHIQKRKQIFSPNQVQIYLAEIAVALSYLHKLGIVFRDLKPGNILIDANGHLKLTDFGLAKYLLVEDSTTTSLCGTHEYLAPEMIKGASYNFAVDWWSFGVVAYQLLEGVLPFESQNLNKLYERIARSPLKFWKPLPNASRSFVSALLQKDPAKRLGCTVNGEKEIFDHIYFSSINWDKIRNKEYRMEFIPDVSKDEVLHNFDANSKAADEEFEAMYENSSYNNDTHVPGFSYSGTDFSSPSHDLGESILV